MTVTAGSLGIVTSVPLSRSGLAPAQAVRHVVATSWLSLALAGAAAGMFALAGGDLVEAVLGEAYAGDVGADIGRLVAVLSPWMIAAVGVAVTFPLAFVSGRTRGLPWIALGALALQVPLAWAGSELLELDGLALALAVSTLLVLAALLVELNALGGTIRRLGAAAAFVAALTLVPSPSRPPRAVAPRGRTRCRCRPAVAEPRRWLLCVAVSARPIRPRGAGRADSWHYLRALR